MAKYKETLDPATYKKSSPDDAFNTLRVGERWTFMRNEPILNANSEPISVGETFVKSGMTFRVLHSFFESAYEAVRVL